MLTHPVGYASYAVPIRQYRYLQSGLLQCMDHSKPPCHLLMLRVINPAHKRLALFGFLLLRTMFTIQGTHMGFGNSRADLHFIGFCTTIIGSSGDISLLNFLFIFSTLVILLGCGYGLTIIKCPAIAKPYRFSCKP